MRFVVGVDVYETVDHLEVEVDFGYGRMAIRTLPPSMTPINVCEHCHRADWVEKVASSIEQAVEFGWVQKVAS